MAFADFILLVSLLAAVGLFLPDNTPMSDTLAPCQPWLGVLPIATTHQAEMTPNKLGWLRSLRITGIMATVLV